MGGSEDFRYYARPLSGGGGPAWTSLPDLPPIARRARPEPPFTFKEGSTPPPPVIYRRNTA